MSTHALAFTIDIGTAGLTLKAALYSAGTIHATVRDVTTGMREIGQGFYEWLPSVIPDGYQGSAMFYTGTLASASNFSGVSLLAGASVNPNESGASDPDSPVITPPDPSICVLFGTLIKPDGTPASHETVKATLVVPRSEATVITNAMIVQRTATTKTDSDGAFQLDLIRTDTLTEGCTYTIECKNAAMKKTLVELAEGSKNITTLL